MHTYSYMYMHLKSKPFSIYTFAFLATNFIVDESPLYIQCIHLAKKVYIFHILLLL